MYEQFTSLGLYYNEVNRISTDYCPAFYRYKIAPFQDLEDIPHKLETQRHELNRVYEVEEYMGETLIVGISRHHADHLEALEHVRQAHLLYGGNPQLLREQKSLPAYVFGAKLAKMCKTLETVKCNRQGMLKGAGRVRYYAEEKCLRGEYPRVTQNSYFKDDKAKYENILDDFREGWHYYLTVLETQLIE
jgi:hypothetical protein